MLKRKDGLYQEYITIKEGGRSKRKYFYGKTKREVLKKDSGLPGGGRGRKDI